jgi:hypothetical protein
MLNCVYSIYASAGSLFSCMYIPRFVINNNTSRKLVVCVFELGWGRYDDVCVHVCDERGGQRVEQVIKIVGRGVG